MSLLSSKGPGFQRGDVTAPLLSAAHRQSSLNPSCRNLGDPPSSGLGARVWLSSSGDKRDVWAGTSHHQGPTAQGACGTGHETLSSGQRPLLVGPGTHAHQDPTGEGPCCWQPESDSPRAREQGLGLGRKWTCLAQGPPSPAAGGRRGLRPHAEERPLAGAPSRQPHQAPACPRWEGLFSPLRV